MSEQPYQSDVREKLIRAQAGDRAAREALVEENLALVKFIVKRFAGRGAEMEDLYQYGCLGLLKAVDRFDPNYPVRFSTYAVPVIMGEIRRYLRDDGPIHVSRTIHERARKVQAYMEAYEAEHNCQPGVGELAGALEDPKNLLATVGFRQSVDYTMVEGRFTVRQGRLVGLDEPRLAEQANAVCKRYLAKA